MGEMTLSDALNEYVTLGMPARNLAVRTRVEYQNDIQDFFDYLSQSPVNRVGEISTVHIDRYLASLELRGFAGATRKRKAITLRSFLLFLYRNNYLSNNISTRIIIPFADISTPYILTHGEYQRLLAAACENSRDTAIITLLLQTGIRLSELCRLTIGDADIDSGHQTASLRVGAGARRSGRVIPLNSKAIQALANYLSGRMENPQLPLFINSRHKNMGLRGVQKLVSKYFKAAGLIGVSVHTLRHTFATHHIARGTNIKNLQAVMGHQDIRTTESYIPLAYELSKKELEENSL